MESVLPDIIQPDLTILFVGINPGTKSGELGHHFAGHSNRFWKFLAESGLTPVKFDAFRDADLLKLNLGITNIADRVTTTAAELSPDELRRGAIILLQKLTEYHPQIAVYLGKIVYQYLSKTADFSWGQQPGQLIPGVIDFVMPNPSGLNRMPIPEQLEYYRKLRELIKR
jgi:TDG/mug DNA glycosylase family protein